MAMAFRCGTNRHSASTSRNRDLVGITATPDTSEDRGKRYSRGREVTGGNFSWDADALGSADGPVSGGSLTYLCRIERLYVTIPFHHTRHSQRSSIAIVLTLPLSPVELETPSPPLGILTGVERPLLQPNLLEKSPRVYEPVLVT